MKIYVNLPGYSFEGLAEPLAAFSSLDEAKAHAAKSRDGDWIDTFEITVDDAAAKVVEVATTYR